MNIVQQLEAAQQAQAKAEQDAAKLKADLDAMIKRDGETAEKLTKAAADLAAEQAAHAATKTSLDEVKAKLEKAEALLKNPAHEAAKGGAVPAVENAVAPEQKPVTKEQLEKEYTKLQDPKERYEFLKTHQKTLGIKVD